MTIANIGSRETCGATLLDMSNGLPPPVSCPPPAALFFTFEVSVAAAADVVKLEVTPAFPRFVSVDNGEGVGSAVGVSVGSVTGSTAELVVCEAVEVSDADCACLVVEVVEICTDALFVGVATTGGDVWGVAVVCGGTDVSVPPLSSTRGHNAPKIFPVFTIPSNVFEFTITLEHARTTAVAICVNCSSQAAEQPVCSKSATLHLGICWS